MISRGWFKDPDLALIWWRNQSETSSSEMTSLTNLESISRPFVANYRRKKQCPISNLGSKTIESKQFLQWIQGQINFSLECNFLCHENLVHLWGCCLLIWMLYASHGKKLLLGPIWYKYKSIKWERLLTQFLPTSSPYLSRGTRHQYWMMPASSLFSVNTQWGKSQRKAFPQGVKFWQSLTKAKAWTL